MNKLFCALVAAGLIALTGCGASTADDNAAQTQQPDDNAAQTQQPDDSAAQTQPTTDETQGQRNALAAAQLYLDTMPFSRSGLIEQLVYEGYSTEDAEYAADHVGADWNEQAAKSAEVYLETMPFSRDGLIEQLEYDGYTPEQAEYGATAAGY